MVPSYSSQNELGHLAFFFFFNVNTFLYFLHCHWKKDLEALLNTLSQVDPLILGNIYIREILSLITSYFSSLTPILTNFKSTPKVKRMIQWKST